MDISNNEKKFLLVASSIVVVGILILGTLILLDVFKKPEPAPVETAQLIDSQQENTNGEDEVLAPIACGDGICTEGEMTTCTIDCTTGIVQESSNSSVTLSTETTKLAQTFVTGDGSSTSRVLGFQFIYPTLSAFTYSIYELDGDLPDEGTLVYSGDYGPFESYFESMVNIENEEISFKPNTTYSLIAEVQESDVILMTIAINTATDAYTDGKLYTYGKLFDSKGEILDEEMQWREIDGAAEFAFLFWIEAE